MFKLDVRLKKLREVTGSKTTSDIVFINQVIVVLGRVVLFAFLSEKEFEDVCNELKDKWNKYKTVCRKAYNVEEIIL